MKSWLVRSMVVLPVFGIGLGALLAGCGGGGGGSTATGTMTLQVNWPSRERYVPPYANSVVISFNTASGLVKGTINRQQTNQGYLGQQKLLKVPVGTHTALVTAYTELDGVGTIVADALVSVTINANADTIVNVSADLNSVIDQLIIDGQPLEVLVGEPTQIVGRAVNSAGDTLLLPPGALKWSVISGNQVGTISSTGVFKATRIGTATLKLAEPGAGKEVTAPVSAVLPAGTGRIEIEVNWPDRSRYVPPYAESVVAKMTLPGNMVISTTINRVGNEASVGEGQFDMNIPIGTYPVNIQAKTQTNGQGTTVAEANLLIEVVDGELRTINVSADLQSVIQQIVIDGQPISVGVDDTVQLTGSAKDSNGNTILLPPGALVWSIVSGSEFASITPQGQITGIAAGVARVRLAENGAGIFAEADVTIVPQVPYPLIYISNKDAAGIGGDRDVYSAQTTTSDGSSSTRLTVQYKVDSATLSPDGTKVTFTGVKDSNFGEVYIMNFDGTGLTRLTSDSFRDADPHISPDGTKIVFASFRNNAWRIFVMNSNGTGQQQLTNETNSSDEFPRWSPDGTKILFQRSVSSGRSDVWVMNADGSGQTNLTPGTPDWSDEEGSWSPDGTKIAFVSTRAGTSQVFTMNTDGSNVSQVTSDNLEKATPVFTPDGVRLIYAAVTQAKWQIYKILTNGSGLTRIVRGTTDDQSPSQRYVP